MKFKNKKNGFTLVELMAVIAILGIIIAISIPVYNKVQKNIKNKNYENLVSLIEQAAAKYASDTNITTLYVNNLIKDGYLDPDDNDGFIYDPRDNKKTINCYLIQVTENSGIYYPNLVEKDYSNDNGECSIAVLNEMNNAIKINLYKKGSNVLITESDSKSWSNDDIRLEAWINNKYERNIKKIEWIFEKENGTNDKRYNLENYTNWNNVPNSYKILEIEAANNTSLTEMVKLKILVNIDNKDVWLQTSSIVKIDKVSPSFLDDSKWLPDENEWAPFKYYTFIPYDADSNYKNYSLINLNESCETASYKNGNEIKVTDNADDNGIIKKICIKDYAGNIAEKNINIKKIDSNAPDCNIQVEGTLGNVVDGIQWYINGNAKIKISARAGISGISVGLNEKESLKNKAYMSATDGNEAESYILLNKTKLPKTYYGIVKTGAGLVKNCTKVLALEKEVPMMNSDISLDDTGNGMQSVIATFFAVDSPASGIAEVSCSIGYVNQNPFASTTSNDNYSCVTGKDINYFTDGNSTLSYKRIDAIAVLKSRAGNEGKTIAITSQPHVCNDTEGIDICEEINDGCGSGYGRYTTTYYSKVNGQMCGNDTSVKCSKECYVDLSKPRISINLTNREIYKKTQKAKIVITYSKGIKEYFWKWSNSKNIEDKDFTNKRENDGKRIEKNVNYANKTGKFYLCVKAVGTNGNTSIKCSEEFYVDNEAPTIVCNKHNNGLSNSICSPNGLVYYMQCDYTDKHSGLNKSNTAWGGPDDRNVNNGNNNSATISFNGNKNGTDTLCARSSSGDYSTKICDKAGNCSSKRGKW